MHIPPLGEYPYDPEVYKLYEIGEFVEAAKYMINKNDTIRVAVMGIQGRGKTNPTIHFTKKLTEDYGLEFDLKRQLYIGEDTIPDIKLLAKKHPRHDHVIIDEAEFLFVPNSRQTRLLKWALASGRGTGINIWAVFPTLIDVHASVIDNHFNWIIQAIYRDHERKKVLIRIQCKAMYSDMTRGGQWLDYPFPDALYWIPYAPTDLFLQWDEYKQRIYEEGEMGTFQEAYEERVKKRKEELRKKQEEEYWNTVQKIASTKYSKAEKCKRMLEAGIKKTHIQAVLGISYNTINRIETEVMRGISTSKNKKKKRNAKTK